ncbi:MAG: hypothetical protein ABI612_14170 [Betaproteobacteria bacterium]
MSDDIASSDRRSPRLFLFAFALSALLLGATLAVLDKLWGPVVGDLTRLGGFPEREFAARKPHTDTLPPARVELADADIIVLGDSFSGRGVWQARFAKYDQRKIITYYFPNVGCISNWVAWVLAQRLKPNSVVVIEIVERTVVRSFRYLEACAKQTPKSTWEIASTHADAKPPMQRFTLIHNPFYVLESTWHYFRHRITSKKFTSGKVIDAPLRNRQLLTNNRSDRLLYYSDEEEKSEWTSKDIADTLNSFAQIKAQFKSIGVSVFVVMIPDKTAVYRDYMVQPVVPKFELADLLVEQQLAPFNLTEQLRGIVAQTPDLFLPNDTHFGDEGYGFLASLIAREIH